MNTSLSLFAFNARHIRALTIDNQPWFVAADVCKACNINKTSRAIAPLARDEKGTHRLSTPGGPQDMSVVSESGLYKLVLSSTKPEAKVFQDWVTRDVLPAIRKDGGHITGEERPSQHKRFR